MPSLKQYVVLAVVSAVGSACTCFGAYFFVSKLYNKKKVTAKVNAVPKAKKAEIKNPDINVQLLNERLVDMKIECMEIYYLHWTKVYKLSYSTHYSITQHFLDLLETKTAGLLHKLPVKVNTLLDLVALTDDKHVQQNVNELIQYRNELQDRKFPSIFKQYFETDQFMKLYLMFQFLQWRYYYIEFNKIVTSMPVTESGKFTLTANDISLIIGNVRKCNLHAKAFEINNIKMQPTPCESYPLYLHSTFYYVIIKDILNSSMLREMQKFGISITDQINKGYRFKQLETDPSGMPPKEFTILLDSLLNSVNDYYNEIKEMFKTTQSIAVEAKP